MPSISTSEGVTSIALIKKPSAGKPTIIGLTGTLFLTFSSINRSTDNGKISITLTAFGTVTLSIDTGRETFPVLTPLRSSMTLTSPSFSLFRTLSCPSMLILTGTGLPATASLAGTFLNPIGTSTVITERPFDTTKNQSAIARIREISLSHGFVVINLLILLFFILPFLW